MQRTYRAVLLLVLVTNMQLLEVVDAVSKKSKREEALEALKPRTVKKGSGGKMKDGTNKSDKIVEIINTINTKARNTRQKGDSTEKTKAKKTALEVAIQVCSDAGADECSVDPDDRNTTAGGGNGGRRLFWHMAMGYRSHTMSPQETSNALRSLLAPTDDGDGSDPELLQLDLEDETTLMVVERIAQGVSEEDLSDLDTMTKSDNTLGKTFQDVLDKHGGGKIGSSGSDDGHGGGGGGGPPASNDTAAPPSPGQDAEAPAAPGGRRLSATNLDGVRTAFASDGRYVRMSIASLLELHDQAVAQRKQAQVQAASARGGNLTLRAQSSEEPLRANYVKHSTMLRVTFDEDKHLAKPITPAYLKTGTNSLALDILGGIKLITPGDTGGGIEVWSEYVQMSDWEIQFTIFLAAQKALEVADKVLEIALNACDLAGSAGGWAGMFGGAWFAPGAAICNAVVLGLQIAVLAANVLVTTMSTYMEAVLAAYDGNLSTAEMEATAENVISVLENQPVLFTEVQTTATETQLQVQTTAPTTQQQVSTTGGEIMAKIDGLEKVMRQRACDLQNMIANLQNTVNHLQRLLLIPEGQRPGYNKLGVHPDQLPACTIYNPEFCAAPGQPGDALDTVDARGLCIGPPVSGPVAAPIPIVNNTTQVVPAPALPAPTPVPAPAPGGGGGGKTASAAQPWVAPIAAGTQPLVAPMASSVLAATTPGLD